MAGDLEDFLRRAAARRQAKAGEQQRDAPPPPKPRPQYSNSRTERRVEPRVEAMEEVLTAELVEDENSIAARTRRVEEAKRAAKAAEAKLREQQSKSKGGKAAAAKQKRVVESSGDIREDLIAELKSPGGIQRAILLREIMDRPEHRW